MSSGGGGSRQQGRGVGQNLKKKGEGRQYRGGGGYKIDEVGTPLPTMS